MLCFFFLQIGRGCVFIAESTVTDSKLVQILFSSRVSVAYQAGFHITELSTAGKEGDMEVEHTFLAGGSGGVRCVTLIDAAASTD